MSKVKVIRQPTAEASNNENGGVNHGTVFGKQNQRWTLDN